MYDGISSPSAETPLDESHLGTSLSTRPALANVDLSTEQIIPFRDVPGLLPLSGKGKKIHVSSVHRWSERGLRGVLLPYLKIGGTRCTSVEALQRFFEAVTSARGDDDEATDRVAGIRAPAVRSRNAERATQQLRRLLSNGHRKGENVR